MALGSCLMFQLTGCTPQQRLTRLVTRHPELVRDSNYVLHMEKFVPGWSFDDVLPFVRGRQIPFQDDKHGISGTITVQDNDSVALHIDKEPDVIPIDTTMNVPTIVVAPVEKKDNRFLWGIVVCAVVFSVFMIISRLK
ncbi:MAG: hypothetical protein K2L50_01780 [Bacteroidales bacterium]|nr:hypothetical protein [Bacteroidales bacterium]